MKTNIQSLINRGAIFYISHSGGKDSQAMYLLLTRVYQIPDDQVVLVHADLGEVEWEGVQSHIRETTEYPLNVVRAVDKDGNEKSLLDSVKKRHEYLKGEKPPWFSPAMRWCTSDFKRNPIEKFIRNDLKLRGSKLAVNCMGMRSEESSARSKLSPFKVNTRLSKAGREIYDWLPIHDWSEDDVFAFIFDNGQQPHIMYWNGMSRLSCSFCVMANNQDLTNAANHRPELYRKYVQIERDTGYTFKAKQSLEEITGVLV